MEYQYVWFFLLKKKKKKKKKRKSCLLPMYTYVPPFFGMGETFRNSNRWSCFLHVSLSRLPKLTFSSFIFEMLDTHQVFEFFQKKNFFFLFRIGWLYMVGGNNDVEFKIIELPNKCISSWEAILCFQEGFFYSRMFIKKGLVFRVVFSFLFGEASTNFED